MKYLLTYGSHTSHKDGNCARELLHYMVTGKHADRTPECLTVCCSVLPILNDGLWRNNKHRTSIIFPYLKRIMLCKRNIETDLKIAKKLAILAKTYAADAAIAYAADAAIAYAAADAADAAIAYATVAATVAADAAADTADTAAAIAAIAVADTAAADAAAATAAAADAATVAATVAADAAADALIEKYTKEILDCICNEYQV
jgi:hypothetical protein